MLTQLKEFHLLAKGLLPLLLILAQNIGKGLILIGKGLLPLLLILAQNIGKGLILIGMGLILFGKGLLPLLLILAQDIGKGLILLLIVAQNIGKGLILIGKGLLPLLLILAQNIGKGLILIGKGLIIIGKGLILLLSLTPNIGKGLLLWLNLAQDIGKRLRVTVIPYKGKKKQIARLPHTTGAMIKEFIFNNYCQQLQLSDMELICSDIIFNDADALSQIAITPGDSLVIKQERKKREVTFNVRTIQGQTQIITFLDSTTLLELKEHIYQKITQSLEPNMMSLTYKGSGLLNSTSLWELPDLCQNGEVIEQGKIELKELSHILKVFPDEQDSIGYQRGVAEMPCGHKIGRDTMTIMIRSLISSKNFEIRCPHMKENGMLCEAILEFKLCKEVGVLTTEEFMEFQEGLSRNWMEAFSKKCPKCSSQVIKGTLTTNRVACPFCSYGDFCFKCLNKWEGKDECKSCITMFQVVTNCPLDRVFKLKVGGVAQDYSTPKFRTCPHCSQLIEHVDACKHMSCKNCKKNFCWVCLSIPKDGQWPCGNFNQYCGKVAPRQKVE